MLRHRARRHAQVLGDALQLWVPIDAVEQEVQHRFVDSDRRADEFAGALQPDDVHPPQRPVRRQRVPARPWQRGQHEAHGRPRPLRVALCGSATISQLCVGLHARAQQHHIALERSRAKVSPRRSSADSIAASSGRRFGLGRRAPGKHIQLPLDARQVGSEALTIIAMPLLRHRNVHRRRRRRDADQWPVIAPARILGHQACRPIHGDAHQIDPPATALPPRSAAASGCARKLLPGGQFDSIRSPQVQQRGARGKQLQHHPLVRLHRGLQHNDHRAGEAAPSAGLTLAVQVEIAGANASGVACDSTPSRATCSVWTPAATPRPLGCSVSIVGATEAGRSTAPPSRQQRRRPPGCGPAPSTSHHTPVAHHPRHAPR